MKISYAITVCNEIEEIKRLIPILLEYKRDEDEIVVLQDITTLNDEVYQYLFNQDIEKNIIFRTNHLNKDFAAFKNSLNSHCLGDYIFQIDADEIPNKNLIFNLPHLIDTNPDIDLFYVPRVNTVEGLTQKHVQTWRWVVDSKGWVNFPDYQSRIYRNTEKLKWIKPVHEVIIGHKQFSHLPQEEEYCLYHPKEIKKQEKQNAFYDDLS